LQLLAFFMADMQAGIGPFLGVFLKAHGWAGSAIGLVMSVGGIVGLLATTPAGALIDATRYKRLLIIVPGLCTVLASMVLLVSQNFWVVVASQSATALAGAVLGPAVAGITLGLVHQQGFARQNGRNQAFNHAGNMVGAAVSGWLAWHFGFPAVIWLAAAFGVVSILSVLRIPASAIDHRIARGLVAGVSDAPRASGLQTLLQCKPLLLLAVCLACFHLANAAMLPFYGLALAETSNHAALLIAETVVVAQGVMILVAVWATRQAEREGYWLILLISFMALPVRGLVASQLITSWGVFPVQILDGIGAGLQSVAVPGVVARVLNGTGRVNVGQGAVMTIQGVGAALSPIAGGWLSQHLGYSAMFLILASLALIPVVIWLLGAGLLKPAVHGVVKVR
jgi:MFS family permease